MNKLFKEAKKKLVIIDGYLDDSIFEYFSDVNSSIFIELITHKISRLSKNKIEKFSKEFKRFEVIEKNNFHDRFVIVDETVYLLGSSINSLGKKLTIFSKIESFNGELLLDLILNK